MEDKIIEMEVCYKSKWEKFKYGVRKRWDKLKNFVREKPREAFMIGSVIVVGLDKLFRAIKKFKELQPTQAELDREWKDTHIYDRSLGMYYPLRRKMTPRECMEFDRRKRAGEPTGHILESMRLLKY